MPTKLNSITFLDRTFKKDEVRIVKSPSELLGFDLVNKTGKHLFVEIEWDIWKSCMIKRLTIHVEEGNVDIPT